MGSFRKELGNRAETIVADYLVEQGAQIVARNLRLGSLEIDIVARIETLILVVEVRYRSQASWETALSSVSLTKRKHLRRAGERLWRRRYRADTSVLNMRFDVAAVSFVQGQPQVEYVPAAF